MYLALFLVAILYLYIVREEKTKLYRFGVLAAVLILFPVTGWLLDKYFQGFYDKSTLQWLLPIFGIIAFVSVDIYKRQTTKWKKCMVIPAICLVLFMSGFVAYTYLPQETNENSSEIEEVYEMILEEESERQITLVAPKEIMENARAYDGRILTAYGRDIWENDLDYAFYGNYEEWAYRLAEYMNEAFDENEELLLEQLAQSGATHVVFDKANLIFDENMHYPSTIKSSTVKFKYMEETHHYVIYAEAR